MGSKTGSGGGIWIEFDTPKPPAVDDHYKYWRDPPPELSPRCMWWVRQMGRGWRPNLRWRTEGYDSTCQLYGVYMWEYFNVIYPLAMTERREEKITRERQNDIPMVQLRKAISELPDAAGIIIEDEEYGRWAINKAFSIGTSTDDPGLVMHLRRTR